MSLTIDATKVGARGKLLLRADPDNVLLTVSPQDCQKLAPVQGAAVYLTLRDAANMERVLLTSASGSSLVVERGMDGTTPQSFRAGACISIEWNPAQIIALLQNELGASGTGYTGTVTTPAVMQFVNGKLVNAGQAGGC